MKILYHHRTLADGAEGIHIDEMVAAFRALGHDVRVLSLAGRATPSGPSAVASGRSGWISSLRQRLPHAAFEAAAVAANVVEYAQVRRAIRHFAPDFVYKRHARYDVAAVYAARDEGVPTVLEVNCLFTTPPYSEFEPVALGAVARGLERRVLQAATICLAVSTPLARQIQRLAGVSPVVMPNGADPARFDPARTAAAPLGQADPAGASPVIGWTGVVRDWHGLDLLLEAAAAVPRAWLLIVGDGPAVVNLRTKAAAMQMSDRLVVTGRVAHEEVPRYVAAMDIAVVADDRTGVASPMKLLEYMAMGRAVVAPRLSNIEDIVTDGETGMLFEPGDAEDLARVLNVLARDVSLRRRLGGAARRTIEGSRHWRRNAEQVIALAAAPRGTTAPGHTRSLKGSWT